MKLAPTLVLVLTFAVACAPAAQERRATPQGVSTSPLLLKAIASDTGSPVGGILVTLWDNNGLHELGATDSAGQLLIPRAVIHGKRGILVLSNDFYSGILALKDFDPAATDEFTCNLWPRSFILGPRTA